MSYVEMENWYGSHKASGIVPYDGKEHIRTIRTVAFIAYALIISFRIFNRTMRIQFIENKNDINMRAQFCIVFHALFLLFL